MNFLMMFTSAAAAVILLWFLWHLREMTFHRKFSEMAQRKLQIKDNIQAIIDNASI